MASIEIGTPVVGGGHTDPRPYLGTDDFGKEVAPRRVIFRASMREGTSGYIAQPSELVPWEAVEAVSPRDERIMVDPSGRRQWVDGHGRSHTSKRAAVLAERIRIARQDFHAAVSA